MFISSFNYHEAGLALALTSAVKTSVSSRPTASVAAAGCMKAYKQVLLYLEHRRQQAVECKSTQVFSCNQSTPT